MEILSDAQFAAAVLELFEGSGRLRCAVAFWGPDLARLAAAREAEVVLEIRMGGTSRNALTAFGLRREELPYTDAKVRVLNNLHAKIFIGDNKAIIGSANASRNALGSAACQPALMEAGVVFDRKTDRAAYGHLEKIYEAYWGCSRAITRKDFDRAVSAPANPAVRDWSLHGAEGENSLLAKLARDPLRFAGSGFLFGDADIADDKLKKAKLALVEETGQPILASRLKHICTFDAGDADEIELRKSVRILWYWYGKKKGVYAYTDVVRVVEKDHTVSYFGRDDWDAVLRDLGEENTPKSAIWAADRTQGREISSRDGFPVGRRCVAMNSEHLFEYIEKQGFETNSAGK